ncbi:MAG: CcdB family protein [Propionivibrio sp.]|jgi:toxin CcdB|uniref:CcdB family protein n=1 Tax=Propionivibrio sp. TaxID=2212460 RepID=UPI001B771211|nr:CcdB family protein [Propionivibrio sp.]MBP7204588.1 CcdB family protein [Propionivibrio sp.]
MARFTVYRNPDRSGYLLDLQADINSHFSTRVVAPLIPIRDIADYAKTLNPVFEIDGERVVMATQGMAAVPLSVLKHPVTSLEPMGAEIVAAIDLLFQGF